MKIKELTGHRLALLTDACLRRSSIMAMFARHLHSIGERFTEHAVAINRDKEHIQSLQTQVNLLNESMMLMIQAKRERLLLEGEDIDLPN